jgi:hypothetical protein
MKQHEIRRLIIAVLVVANVCLVAERTVFAASDSQRYRRRALSSSTTTASSTTTTVDVATTQSTTTPSSPPVPSIKALPATLTEAEAKALYTQGKCYWGGVKPAKPFRWKQNSSFAACMTECRSDDECGGVAFANDRKTCYLSHGAAGGDAASLFDDCRAEHDFAWMFVDPSLPPIKHDARAFPATRGDHVYGKPGSLAAADFNWDGECNDTDYKCVVSFGLYGDNPKYVGGAVKNCELMGGVFPAWVMRVYHDKTVTARTLQQLKDAGCRLELVEVTTGQKSATAGMFWRFYVADDDTVQRWIVRDSDSRVNKRSANAVAEWFRSGYSFQLGRRQFAPSFFLLSLLARVT